MSQSATEPISLSEAKSHLRVDFNDDDTYITTLISVARDYAEGFQKRSLITKTLELTQDYFTNPIILENLPCNSVTSVNYTRLDGTVGTVDPTTYIVTQDGKIVPKYYWPPDVLQVADGVKVTYTVGSTTIDPATKHALLLLIGNFYEFREPIVVGKTVENVPLSVKQLLYMGKVT